MSDDDDEKFLPKGRFTRFRKMASLSASIAADVASRGIKKFSGSDPIELSKATAEKLVSSLGDMKGLAMKLGQAMSMDPESMPPQARAVLARLQNQAPPMPWPSVEKLFVAELKARPEELFADFDRTPLAAASLGQVHRATTKDGQKVVVKVQYPEIAEGLAADLDNLGVLVKTLGSTPMFDVRRHFADVRAEFLSELDYHREAQLMRRFADAVKPWPDLVVPLPHEALSAKRVLTLDFLEGPTLKDFLQTDAPNDARFRVSTQLIRAVLGPFFKGGLMHVDPHPGNYLVMPDGRLGILDFGAVKQFSDVFIDVNRKMLRKGVFNDPSVNVPELSRRVGFQINLGDADVVRLVDRFLDITCRQMREPTFDWATDDSRQQLMTMGREEWTRFKKFVPPVEAPLFFRAIGGLFQNQKALRASGPFRDTWLALSEFGG